MLGIFGRKKTQEGLRKSRQGLFGRIAGLLGGATLEEHVWDELEELLVEGDVGSGTATRLIESLKRKASEERMTSPQAVLVRLKEEILTILKGQPSQEFPLELGAEAPKPLVILAVGVNGVGKTTSIAKLAHYFKEQGKSVVLGAADTFRAAGIEQLEVWGKRLEVDVITHKSGADPGAVAYDTFQAARARGVDVAIIDTAGRLHTKHNLMEELKKMGRVLSRLDEKAPHVVLLVMDATTGQNGLTQAKSFTEAVKCSGLFLAKLDGTAKGGIVIPIVEQLKVPVLFIGTGEKVEDMAPFDPGEFVEALFSAPEESSKV